MAVILNQQIKGRGLPDRETVHLFALTLEPSTQE